MLDLARCLQVAISGSVRVESTQTGSPPSLHPTLPNLRDLTRDLADHEVMKPDINDPYIKPANHKAKVYYVWNFMGRTVSMVLANEPDLPLRQKGLWREVSGRANIGRCS